LNFSLAALAASLEFISTFWNGWKQAERFPGTSKEEVTGARKTFGRLLTDIRYLESELCDSDIWMIPEELMKRVS
jgi:hypothetical protein